MNRRNAEPGEIPIIKNLFVLNVVSELNYKQPDYGAGESYAIGKIKDVTVVIYENSDRNNISRVETAIGYDIYTVWREDMDEDFKAIACALLKEAKDKVHSGYALQEQINRILGDTQ